MDEDLFCAIAFFKFRWTDELSKVGQKKPKFIWIRFLQRQWKKSILGHSARPILNFFLFPSQFQYLPKQYYFYTSPISSWRSFYWGILGFFFKHKVGHYLLISFPKLMHRLNGLEKYKKQEQTDFYHNNSGYDSNKSSLFPKHSHYHNNDSLRRTRMFCPT